jgi:hypothetical protein
MATDIQVHPHLSFIIILQLYRVTYIYSWEIVVKWTKKWRNNENALSAGRAACYIHTEYDIFQPIGVVHYTHGTARVIRSEIMGPFVT